MQAGLFSHVDFTRVARTTDHPLCLAALACCSPIIATVSPELHKDLVDLFCRGRGKSKKSKFFNSQSINVCLSAKTASAIKHFYQKDFGCVLGCIKFADFRQVRSKSGQVARAEPPTWTHLPFASFPKPDQTKPAYDLIFVFVNNVEL